MLLLLLLLLIVVVVVVVVVLTGLLLLLMVLLLHGLLCDGYDRSQTCGTFTPRPIRHYKSVTSCWPGTAS
jgi:hypothetical protein